MVGDETESGWLKEEMEEKRRRVGDRQQGSLIFVN